MSFEPDCVRDLLRFLGDGLSVFSSGKRPHPIHLKRVLSVSPLDGYPPEVVYEAARYLYQKKLIVLTNDTPLPKSLVNERFPVPLSPPQPRAYIIRELTAQGQDLLKAFGDNTFWQKARHKLSGSLWGSVPELVAFLLGLIPL